MSISGAFVGAVPDPVIGFIWFSQSRRVSFEAFDEWMVQFIKNNLRADLIGGLLLFEVAVLNANIEFFREDSQFLPIRRSPTWNAGRVVCSKRGFRLLWRFSNEFANIQSLNWVPLVRRPICCKRGGGRSGQSLWEFVNSIRFSRSGHTRTNKCVVSLSSGKKSSQMDKSGVYI